MRSRSSSPTRTNSNKTREPRDRRLTVLIPLSDPKPVFYIRTYDDFIAALEDSISLTPQYLTYSLQTNLTFDSDNKPYVDLGSFQEDYFRIGTGQTFDGNGFTITLVPGCEPFNFQGDGSYLPAIFGELISSDIESLATIQNLAVHVLEDVLVRSVLIYEDIEYASLKNINILFESSNISETNSTYLVFRRVDEESFCDTLNIQITNPIAVTDSDWNFYVLGNPSDYNKFTLSNCYIIAPSVGLEGYIFNDGTEGSTYIISNTYIYLYDQGVVNQNCGIFYGANDPDTTLTLTDLYVVYNSFNQVSSFTSPAFIDFNTANNSVINYTNVYTNNNNANIGTITPGTNPTINGAVSTSFTWSSPPVFSPSSGFDASTPNRLSAFLTYPFNASTYPTFDYLSMMLQSTTSLPDAVVNTQSGYQFLFRMTNPNGYAPIPKVITNEYIRRRDRASNYIPSRNGYVSYNPTTSM